MFLVSCGTNPVSEENLPEELDVELQQEINDLQMSNQDMSKVEVINYSYTNPAQEVNMKIKYSLNDNGEITQVDISSDNWDKLWDFNTAAKEKLIGLTLEQASETDVASGSSLTNAAFSYYNFLEYLSICIWSNSVKSSLLPWKIIETFLRVLW